jgi:hypothetical protein
MTYSQTRRTRVVYFAIAVGLYFLFLFATIPSGWLSWGLSRASGGAVHLYHAQGSLWRGTGDLAITLGPNDAVHLGRFNWKITPLRILIGQLKIRLRTVDFSDPSQATLTIGFRQYAFTDVNLALPARLATLAYPAAALMAPSGRLQITSKSFKLASKDLQGEAVIVWRNAGSGYPKISDLGDYRLTVTGKGENASLSLSTMRGVLAVAAHGQWQVGSSGDLQLNGSIKPTAQANELEPLLQRLGPDRGNGQRTFNVKTRLPVSKLMGR